jgi:hypothetical protein
MNYVTSVNQDYVQYNDREAVKGLDINVWHSSNSIIADGATGRHLYQHEPRHPAYYACDRTRDPGTQYIMGIDVEVHPDHSSRFGYAKCPNGYCSGHWPGRYIESTRCADYDPQPPDMAPARFYTAEYQGPLNCKSQAIVDYNYMKNHGMNYPSWWKYPKQDMTML